MIHSTPLYLLFYQLNFNQIDSFHPNNLISKLLSTPHQVLTLKGVPQGDGILHDVPEGYVVLQGNNDHLCDDVLQGDDAPQDDGVPQDDCVRQDDGGPQSDDVPEGWCLSCLAVVCVWRLAVNHPNWLTPAGLPDCDVGRGQFWKS